MLTYLQALQRVDGIDYSLLEQELTESAAASESTERQMVHLQDRATKSFGSDPKFLNSLYRADRCSGCIL